MLYACGSNGSGQLGLGHHNDASQWTAVDVTLDGPINISSGGNHTIIIEIETGRSLVTEDRTFRPLTHPYRRKWRLASAGWDFSYLVDDSNSIWQLSNKGDLTIMSCDFIAPIIDIRSGMRHTVLALSDGKVYGWGASRKGQCGVIARQVNEPNLFDPQRIHPRHRQTRSDIDRNTSLSCGRDYTVISQYLDGDEQAQLSYWGPDGKFENLNTEPAVGVPVRSGWSHVLVGSQMYGRNFHNQLNIPVIDFDDVALGSEHGICVKNSTVYTWGWGEHGNCPGPKSFDSSRVQIFGGCATSFVYVL